MLSKSALPVALSGIIAATLSVWLRSYPTRSTVPVLFLLCLVSVACRYDRMTSFLTAIFGALIFAIFLFPPYGSLVVANTEDQVALVGFAMASLVIVHCSPTPEKASQ